MNVKQEFLKWISQGNSYRNISETIKYKYIDQQVVFLAFDPFELNDEFSNIEEIKENILTRTKELKNSNREYLDFQNKSQSSVPEAILGKKNYFVFLDEIKNQKKSYQLDLSELLKQPEIQSIIKEPEFYFKKGQDCLRKWLDFPVSDQLRVKLIKLSNNYEEIQEVAKTDDEVKHILELLFEIVSYCDLKAKDKIIYNKYTDKRVLAMAAVRMNSWIAQLINYKFFKDPKTGSIKNAIEYLLNPQNNATVLSENHRELIAKNLFKKEYIPQYFINELKNFFVDYNLNTNNPDNYTHLLTRIIYNFQSYWKEEVIGLMAADNTGWQKEFIDEMKGFEGCIVWNSTRPVGGAETLKFLKKIIEDDRSFNLYYSSHGMVNYKATIIDFAENQQDLDTKEWDKTMKILYFYSSFDNYTDSNKSAKIIFLAKTLEKLEPIAVSKFKFYGKFQPPTQSNLAPVSSEPEEIEAISINNDRKVEDMKILKNPQSLNQIFFGPPGTGKTYNTINRAIEIANPMFDLKQTRNIIQEEYERLKNKGQIVFTTFHQSMSYEDFIEGLKPLKPQHDDGFVKYDIVQGIFKRLCRKAEITPNNSFDIAYKKLLSDLEIKGEIELKDNKVSFKIMPSESGNDLRVKSESYINNITKEGLEYVNKSNRYAGVWGQYYKVLFQYLKDQYDYKESETTEKENHVIIIDEINRGNISQIFGELITLIEEDKRLGKEEELEVILPYSKEKFGIPANLYIIGTMNTADRSVEALDAALRRRFSFEEMPPKYNLKELDYSFAGIEIRFLLQTINDRIEKLLDKDHSIGHSYFILKENERPETQLPSIFYRNIIPLLQEYFFGDYGKIGLVLGKGFVCKKEWNKDNIGFAEFANESVDDYDDKDIFEIVNYTNPKLDYTIQTKEGDVKMNFEKAIEILMNQK